MSGSLRSYLDFAMDTSYQAGRLTLGYFRTGILPEMKPDDSLITIADRRAEEFIAGRIENIYPDHAILGEEYGLREKEAARHRWIIDPIDGTIGFVHGVPLYGVLIGLEIEGSVEVGVAYFPALDEIVAAATGEGCFWNGRRSHVSTVSSLSRAFVVHCDVKNFDEYDRQVEWERIKNATYATAGLGDAYGYALVATGRAELMLDPRLHIWDCAPFPPILKEAGGYYGDWQGQISITADEALATSQALLPEVVRVIRGD